MEIYRCNRNCDCTRCRLRGSMFSILLVVVGVLLLLDEGFHIQALDFDRTWPLILITVGVMLTVQRTASLEGHVQPYIGPPLHPMPPPAPPSPAPSGSSSSAIEVRHE